jgi:hypothetical protein
MLKTFEFTFFTGQRYVGEGLDERDALRRLGLGAYNPAAYDAKEVKPDGKKASTRNDKCAS